LIPQAQAGPKERPPTQAGRFYPAESDELESAVGELLSGEAPASESWPAVLIPHGALKFSGKVAADVLRSVKIPETVVVLCPKHTAMGVEWAVAPHDVWQLPGGGAIASDPELARRMAERIDGLELDAAAHFHEHAVEVELPILARLAPNSKVIGVAIGGGSLERLQQFGEGLADVLGDRREQTLLVVSSDMNHFASDEENRRLDEIAMQLLETLDPAKAFDGIAEQRITMCGLRPAVVALDVLRRWNMLSKSRRVGYCTTADENGETARVVGYAGMLFG
jgi:AmmeMemoRadiSam system protein B